MKNDGGPVYPNAANQFVGNGISLRDWFAGQYLTGCAAQGHSDSQFLARKAYSVADAMIKERNIE